jgi:hypothetical protein
MTLPFVVHTAKALLLFRSRFFSCCRSCCRSCSRSNRPVVQVMSYAVAVRTIRELVHHSCWVRNPVAILAFRHHLVLLLMAGYAEEGFMLGFAGNKQAVCFCVTGSTLLGRGVCCIGDSLWHMSFVALLAVTGALISRVGFMALGTLRNFAMDIMTE